jgi:hypothetical protein
MIASEFSQFVDELIPELAPHLPGVAAEYLSKQGSGAIRIELHDAEEPEQRTSVISYLPHDQLPVGSHIRQLTSEYDPQREIVLQVDMDRMVVTRKLSLTDLRRYQPASHAALET